jgi:hypothetical protein
MSIEDAPLTFASGAAMPRIIAELSQDAWRVEMRLFDVAMQDVLQLQKNLSSFLDRRATADVQFMESLVQCASPGTLVDLQAGFWSNLVTDYAETGQRGLCWLGDAVQHCLDEMGKHMSSSELAVIHRPKNPADRHIGM